jgi:ubiquitin carboxyl-terminal hydrolase 22/27/51
LEKEESQVGIELAKTIKQLFNGQEKPFSPDKLLVTVWKNIETFAQYTQQDAHEFLMALLNEPGVSNVATNTFKGMMESDIVCTKCNSCFSTFDPILDISLGVKRENVEMGSLGECLARFIRKEKLSSFYTCKKCNQKVIATKQMIIKSLPPVICFHLKRFEQMEELSHHSTKIDHFVEFPKNIDMSAYTVNPQKKMVYKLISIVEHRGNMDSGHYVSYIKQNGNWWLFDDARILRITEKDVAKCNAYLLFYAKSDL